jgi:DNA-binding NarL/FixJ family response regulator
VEASNGQEAIEQARKTNPDIIILDLAMPVMTGIEAARRLKKEMPQIPILIMSMHDDGHAMARELAPIGIQGFVSKTDAAQKLPDYRHGYWREAYTSAPRLPSQQTRF